MIVEAIGAAPVEIRFTVACVGFDVRARTVDTGVWTVATCDLAPTGGVGVLELLATAAKQDSCDTHIQCLLFLFPIDMTSISIYCPSVAITATAERVLFFPVMRSTSVTVVVLPF